MIEPRVVEAGGVRSPVYEAGPADAPEAVVFVHGNPGGGDDWAQLQRAVSPFARTLAPDMPGFAGADKPRSHDWSVEGQAAHLARVLGELGVSRAHFVLHDFGAAWGLECVAANPQLAASVTLLGDGVIRGYRWHRWARVWRTPVIGELTQYLSPPAVARIAIARENPLLSREQVARLTRAISPYPTRRAVLAIYRATPSERYEFRSWPSRRERVADALAPLDLPALAVWPTEDSYIPFQPEDQLDAFPSARIEVLEGHGHWLHWEAPERVAELVVPFLREQVGVPA